MATDKNSGSLHWARMKAAAETAPPSPTAAADLLKEM